MNAGGKLGIKFLNSDRNNTEFAQVGNQDGTAFFEVVMFQFV